VFEIFPKVDVRFQVFGEQIPSDHGYILFSSLCKIAPFIHHNRQIAIHHITGRSLSNRRMDITEGSFLSFRVPTDSVDDIVQLAGSIIRLGGDEIRLGVPRLQRLIPAVRLYSPLVVIKGFMETEPFMDAVQRQLTGLEVKGTPMLIEQPGNSDFPFARRTLRVKDKEIVGFALMIDNLTAEESIRVQEHGIGGRQRFGCGVFLPMRDKRW
jgi:CRISPR-associated protein Cas6